MQESLAKDQFIDSLLEEDMRLKIRQSRPKSLRGAVGVALELEAFQLASRQRVKAVRGAAIETPTQTEVSADDVCKQDDAMYATMCGSHPYPYNRGKLWTKR